MVPLIVWMLAVAFARLTIWHDRDSRAFTESMFLLALGYAFLVPAVAEPVNDATGVRAFADLASALILAASTYLIGRVSLRHKCPALARKHQAVYGVFMSIAAAAMIVASDFGDRPLGGARIYQSIQAITVAVTALLILRKTLERPRRRRLLPITAAAVGAVASGTTYIVGLAFAPAWVERNDDVMALLFAVPILLGFSIAGLYGPVQAWRRRRANGRVARGS